jgi:hypothetical protein
MMAEGNQSSDAWWDAGDGENSDMSAEGLPIGRQSTASLSQGVIRAPQVPQRFLAINALAVPALFLVFSLAMAAAVLGSSDQRPLVTPAVLFGGAAVFVLVRFPYAALVTPDGMVMFKAVFRTSTTSISQIRRIGRTRGHGGSWMYAFQYDGGRSGLPSPAGRPLAQSLVERNPAIEYPARMTWPGRFS